METELTESSEINSKTDNLAVTDEADVDEAIPIYLKNNEKHKNIRKQWTLVLKISTHLKKKQSKYNSMEENLRSYRRSLFGIIWYFPVDFIKKCKDDRNEAQFVPLDVKNNINWMAMEQGLYAWVVIIRWKN